MTSPTRATHRCLSLPPQIGVHEGALESVHEREFAKFLFSLQSFVWRTQRGLIGAPAIPKTGPRRTSEVHRQHAPQPPPARRHTMVRLEKGFVTGPSCSSVPPKELMETQSKFIGIQSMQADTTVY